MKYFRKFFTLLFFITDFILIQTVNAQVSKAVDLDKYPPQWVWKKQGYGNQWMISESIQKELQRIFQPLPDGIHATFSIAYGDRPAMGAGTPKFYGPYLICLLYTSDAADE